MFTTKVHLTTNGSSSFPEIDVSKLLTNQLRLSGLYLDPSGEHLILATVSRQQGDVQPVCQLLYLNRRSTKVKQVQVGFIYFICSLISLVVKHIFMNDSLSLQTSKFRGSEVTSVGWSYDMSSESSTGPILLGTSKGAIFETEIKIDGDRIFGNSLEQYFKQVWHTLLYFFL